MSPIRRSRAGFKGGLWGPGPRPPTNKPLTKPFLFYLSLMISAKLQNTTDVDEPEELWMDIKSSILEAAEDTCGKQVPTKRRHWMTTDILDKMEERRLCKNDTTETGQRKYRQLRQEVQRLCRRAKNEFTNNKCSEIEKLEATHNPLLHKKIKEMLPKKYINTQPIKDKHGNLLQNPQDILE